MGRGVVFYGWFLAAIGAAFWLTAALLVAYPKHFFVNHSFLEFAAISNEFFGLEWLERIFLPLLILIDIAIDAFIHHFIEPQKNETLKRRITIPMIICGVFYIIFCAVIPHNTPDMLTESKVLFMVFALLCLFVIRWISLVPIVIFHGNER